MKIKGFSLIEQMIVVGMVALLASTAYPSFQRHFQKARRAEAQSTLYAFSVALERFRSEHPANSYIGATSSNQGIGPGAPYPNIFPSQSPLNSSEKFYDLEIFSASSSDYELRAIPLSGSAQADDHCGTLVLKSTGEQSNLNSKGSDISTHPCWK